MREPRKRWRHLPVRRWLRLPVRLLHLPVRLLHLPVRLHLLPVYAFSALVATDPTGAAEGSEDLFVTRAAPVAAISSAEEMPAGSAASESLAAGAPGAPLRELWSRKLGRAIKVPPLLVSRRLFVVNTEGRLHCLRVDDGQKLWSRNLKDPVEATLAHTRTPGKEGQIHAAVAGRKPRLEAFDATTGKLRWRTRLGGLAEQVQGGEDHVWVLLRNGELTCLRTRDGSAVWSRQLESWGPAGFCRLDSLLVLVAREDSVIALEAATGAPRWQRSHPGRYASPPVPQGDGILLLTTDGLLLTVDAARGEAVAREQRDAPQFAMPLAGGGRVTTVTGGGLVESGGALEFWKRPLRQAVTASPAEYLDLVLVGTGRGRLVALDPSSGDSLWTHQANGGFRVAPLADGDRLILATDRGRVSVQQRTPPLHHTSDGGPR